MTITSKTIPQTNTRFVVMEQAELQRMQAYLRVGLNALNKEIASAKELLKSVKGNVPEVLLQEGYKKLAKMKELNTRMARCQAVLKHNALTNKGLVDNFNASGITLVETQTYQAERSRSAAWLKVTEALDGVDTKWFLNGTTGVEAAINTIESLK